MKLPYPAQRQDPLYPYFPPRPSSGRFAGVAADGRLPELHLYDGSRCNRSCGFCVVAGSPQGWHRPYCRETLDFALELLTPRGLVKFYGGEPTLHPDNLLEAVAYLRQGGFEGSFRIYSNGVRARHLLAILEAVPEMDAVLNYSILHGRGVPPIPEKAMQRLLDYPPGRIFSGHTDLVEVGNPEALPGGVGDFGGGCAQCHPVLRTDGRLHGCPFAVEIEAPVFELGRPGDATARVVERYRRLLRWQVEVLEPEAKRRGLHPCQVCDRHLDQLPG